jgi:hypothetical protein
MLLKEEVDRSETGRGFQMQKAPFSPSKYSPENAKKGLYLKSPTPYWLVPPTMSAKSLLVLVGIVSGALSLQAQSPYQSSADFAKYAMKLRENALLRVEPQVVVPTMSGTSVSAKYPWKMNIVTTVFWIGESASANNPVDNHGSSWDPNWRQSYGGFDNPDQAARRNYIPANFIPQQNPFYVALPYNDVTRGTTKPEAFQVIPWIRETFERPGKSVCRDRWVAIRSSSGRICYAQWSDCGPFRTDHWQYVFGNERPKPNLNKGAGLDVSPAVRDYLRLRSTDVTDWKFVEYRDVPRGPWSYYGENNHFVLDARRTTQRVVSKAPADSAAPTVIVK